jgi:hypothetical protein
MKGFRFSLGSMFLGVAAVSIVCAALVKPSVMWAMILQASSLGILTLAILAALIYERGMARAFWIGFAVVGWGNLGWHWSHFSELSVTGEITEWLMNAIHPELPPAAAATIYLDSAARTLFPYIIVWIWPALFGFVGGLVAQQLYLRRERLAARPPPGETKPPPSNVR